VKSLSGRAAIGGSARHQAVVVDGGAGQLYDVSMKAPKVDNQSDRLAQGKWNWTFQVSGGTAVVPSTLAGDRTGVMLVRLADVDQLNLASCQQLGNLLRRVVGIHALSLSTPAMPILLPEPP